MPEGTQRSLPKKSMLILDSEGNPIDPATELTVDTILEVLHQLFTKIPRLVTLPTNDALRVYTDNSTLYNYEYLNTSSAGKTMLFDGPVQTQLLATVQRSLIGF